MTTKPDGSTQRTTVGYADGRQIDGERDLVDALFDDAGALTQSLPNSLANPLAAGADLTTIQQALAGSQSGRPPIETEPAPFAQLERALAIASPVLTSPAQF